MSNFRTQSRPGKSGDPGRAGPAAASVDRSADWIQNFATLQRVSRPTNGRTTSPSGPSVGKPIPSTSVLGKF